MLVSQDLSSLEHAAAREAEDLRLVLVVLEQRDGDLEPDGHIPEDLRNLDLEAGADRQAVAARIDRAAVGEQQQAEVLADQRES